MLRVIDAERLGIPEVRLDGPNSAGKGGEPCPRCEAFRPAPELSGNLRVDPEIHLPSVGMDVDIAYYYNANSNYNGPFGYGRTLSTNLGAQASGSPLVVTLTRGNGNVGVYSDNGSGTFVPQTLELTNTLVKNTAAGLWQETTPGGITTAYPLDTSGAVTSVSYAQDGVGNTHTFTYSSGLLTKLQDAVGRLVTFGYANSLLQTIEDWAGRVTTFAYDTASVAGKPMLTTVTGPSGCQTAYGYDSQARLTRVTDPNGYQTSYTYDSQSRVLTRSVGGGGGVTTYSYNGTQMASMDPQASVTTYTSSNVWKLMGVVGALGAAATYTRNTLGQVTTSQNALGAVWSTSYDSLGNVIGGVDALGNTATLTRDSYNNIAKVQNADSTVATQVWGYSGSGFDTTGVKRRLQAYVDALGNRTSYGYTGRGQLQWAQDPLGYVTSYGYDDFGNRISMTDPLGNVTTQSYDLAGNVLTVMDPERVPKSVDSSSGSL